MANFVRDGIAMDIPDAQLALLKACFDKADEQNQKLEDRINALSKVKIGRKEYLADNQILELLSRVGKMVSGMSGKDDKNYDIDANVSDDLMSDLEMLQSQIAELKAKEEALLKELEMAQADKSNLKDQVNREVKDRRDLERKVFKLLDMAEPEMEQLSNRELKEALIIQRYSKLPNGYTRESLQEKSEQQIDAMFEVATFESNLDSQAAKAAPIPEPVVKDAANSLAEAYQQQRFELENAWKQALS